MLLILVVRADLRDPGIYSSVIGGMSWEDDWGSGGDVLDDPWLFAGSGDVDYRVDAESGELRITGNTHRLYVRDPRLERQWRDVEVTVYFKRGNDGRVPYSGMTSVVRANHGVTAPLEDAPCDSRGLSARMRNDGTVDFGKETAHPATAAAGGIRIWRGELPRDVWIGYKHVVYDQDDGGVRQEVWIDRPDGVDGNWLMVATHVDYGFGWGKVPCRPGIDPAMALDSTGTRDGSESGLPNISVYFRADRLGQDGLVYRDASIREIIAPQRPFAP